MAPRYCYRRWDRPCADPLERERVGRMTRSAMEIRIPKGIDELRNFLNGWFTRNEFVVVEWQASRQEIIYKGKGARWTLHPRPGFVVAIQPTMMSNAVAIEMMLIPENTGTLVHGEFYIPPMGFLDKKELAVNVKGIDSHMPVIKRGSAVMTNFTAAICEIGGIVIGAVGGSQPVFMHVEDNTLAPIPLAGASIPAQPQYGAPMPQSQPQYTPQYVPPPAQPQQSMIPQAPPPPPMQVPPPTHQPSAQQAVQQMTQPGMGQMPPPSAASSIIYCIYCGKELPSMAKFCARCGKQVVHPK